MKLPEPAYQRLSDLRSRIDNWYSADQMRQMRIDTLEEAAKICDRRPRVDMFRYIANRENAYYAACADAIRALKEEKHD